MIKKGLKVRVLTGKDKKKEGEVIEIDRQNFRAKVKEINMVKKHVKTTKEKKQKTLRGVVVSDKMQDTVVVEVSRYMKHPKYGKYVMFRKKYKADDKGNTKKVGEKVVIEQTRPISKDKHFRVV